MSKENMFLGWATVLSIIAIILTGLVYLLNDYGVEKASTVLSGITLLLFVIAGCCYYRSSIGSKKV